MVLVTTAAYARFLGLNSAEKRAWPVTFGRPSTRLSGLPRYVCASRSGSGALSGMNRAPAATARASSLEMVLIVRLRR